MEIPLYTLHGPEKVLFYVGPGCVFGEVSCFVTGERDEASVRARTDCVLYFFSRDLIEGVIASQYPHLLIELVRALAYKLRMYGVLLQDSLNSDNFMPRVQDVGLPDSLQECGYCPGTETGHYPAGNEPA